MLINFNSLYEGEYKICSGNISTGFLYLFSFLLNWLLLRKPIVSLGLSKPICCFLCLIFDICTRYTALNLERVGLVRPLLL